jgi:hypothetical protein
MSNQRMCCSLWSSGATNSSKPSGTLLNWGKRSGADLRSDSDLPVALAIRLTPTKEE